MQGEGGVRPLAPEVLRAAREACDRVGALLIVDEVQTGIGRTGPWFAFQDTDVVPDVVTVAKALANGLPIGACIAHGEAAKVFEPGDHATTFGGNPVACAAANAVIATIEADGHARDRPRAGRPAARRARRRWSATAPFAAGSAVVGLLLGLTLDAPVAAEVVAACRDRRLLVNAVGAGRGPARPAADRHPPGDRPGAGGAARGAGRRRIDVRPGGGTVSRILVVEDDPHVLALLTSLLEFEGHDVVTAVDGLEGLFKVRNADVDAVLLDVMMPDIDGTRVLQQLLEEHDGSLPVPVLVMTGSPLGARRCRELLGIGAVIDKPFDPDDLVERVREMLAPDADGPTP